MNAHTVEKYKDWTIEIHNDTDPMNPRTDFDNLGTMCCWHRRMNLGDNPEKVERFSPIGYMTNELLYNYESKIPYPKDSYCEDWLMEDDARVIEYFNKFHIVIPINAYEHGGITISAGRSYPYNDTFDSGQLGFIYISKEKALKEFSQKKWSKKLEEKIIRILEGEIKTYDQYLTGDVHGFCIYRPEDEDCENVEESVWGFYGSKYCMEEARMVIDSMIEYEKKQEKLLNVCMSL